MNVYTVTSVRREDLNSSSSVRSSSHGDNEEIDELQRVLREKLQEAFVWEEPSCQRQGGETSSHEHAGSESAGQDEAAHDSSPAAQEFEFRLFKSAKPGVKVLLEDERPFKPGEGGIVAKRPTSFYRKPPASAQERRRFSVVSITGQEVIDRSLRPSWGQELPWKVVARLTASPMAANLDLATPSNPIVASDEDGKSQRTRPGKKTRTARRKKERETKSKQEKEELEKIAKEEHLKAKKKRLNHAKKLRARAKAKEKKAGRAASGHH